METSLKIANARDETNNPSVSNEIECGTAIIPFETIPLDSDHVKSAPITSDDISITTYSAGAQDDVTDCSISGDIKSSTYCQPPSYRKYCSSLCKL